jgi:hypothetical protein
MIQLRLQAILKKTHEINVKFYILYSEFEQGGFERKKFKILIHFAIKLSDFV